MGFVVGILFCLFVVVAPVVVGFPQGASLLIGYGELVLLCALYVGRLHDMGCNGWYAIVALIGNGIGLVLLAVWPGQKIANEYGKVPPGSLVHLLRFWRK